MESNLSRRSFLKIGGASVATVATAGVAGSMLSETAAAAAPHAMGRTATEAVLPKAKGQRVVVVGGGWSGLSVAKYVKKEAPELDVVLIEKNNSFMSCPMSNLWLAGLVDLEFLSHSYLDAAKNNNYLFFNATVVDVDRTKRQVYTDQGYVKYDYLVLSPGIDYNYEAIGVSDPADQFRLRTQYPAGFMPGSEHLSIKRKLEEFEGGTFLLTVPAGNYRCLPGPYERACLMAHYFKKNKIKGEVLLLDANANITIKAEGFQAAFDDLYKGVLRRVASAEIKGVDLAAKTVKTEFDTYNFTDAAIYPRVRGSRLLETLGLVAKNTQMEANIDVLKYHVKGDERVFVAGDSRPMPFSKSGNTSNSEGRFLGKLIAAKSRGKDLPWESPRTICYSMVNGDPEEAIKVDAFYKYDPAKGFSFDRAKVDNTRTKDLGIAAKDWAKGMYRDMFS